LTHHAEIGILLSAVAIEMLHVAITKNRANQFRSYTGKPNRMMAA
jgi:hypothetical protein